LVFNCNEKTYPVDPRCCVLYTGHM
jgi:hypothetical protein